MATFVYDDDCGFCSWWADLFARHSSMGIVGFSALTDAERERLPEDYEDCAHLLADDGVYSCGAAIEEALVRSDFGVPRELVSFLGGFEDYERLREAAYRWGADRRDEFGQFVFADAPVRREPGDGDADGDSEGPLSDDGNAGDGDESGDSGSGPGDEDDPGDQDDPDDDGSTGNG